ncbi:unnamed protein product [Clonostachys rosea f. rosea IK726]|uniref:Uncharacterized protein n=1 Tax=Clonostachys rosea f. rosea IK726 TaxID=1349383 RepID=A0ACA9UW70_BIOOC|nr:unnamed protein product [Clonostachys rosea f. rosea IK726]
MNKLNVIIVGSGLAGLTAARILREHHNVKVYERGDASTATGGQGIMIAPNGVKILESIGYNQTLAGAVPILGFRTYGKDGAVKEDIDVNLKHKFGADALAQKRADFRNELLRLATAPSAELGIQGSPAQMVFNSPVVALDPEEGIITFEDGSTDSADVVIVADGVHSRLRKFVLGEDGYETRKTGLTCYRIAVSVDDAKKALDGLPLPHWWEPETCKNRLSLIHSGDESARFVTVYPLSHQTFFNLSCIAKVNPSNKALTESWHADADLDQLAELFSDFHEPLRRIINASMEVKVWELQDLEALPTWTRGRTMIIGDAAHAMTPMQGQGANMGIEDAESLRLLAPGTLRQDVPAILKLAESVRKPRVEKVLSETRKAHSRLGVVERMARNWEFNSSYSGVEEALDAKRKDQAGLENQFSL